MIHIIDDRDYSTEALKVYHRLGAVTFGPEIHSDTQVLVVRLDPVDKDMIDSLPNLKIIAFNATGQDHIDVTHAKKKGIMVVSLKDDSFNEQVPASSEHAFGLILSCLRKYGKAFGFVSNPQERSAYKGNDLRGRKLGIIGYGRIGKRVAKYATTFGMDVLHCDPCSADNTNINRLLKFSDVILLSLSLNSHTKNSFGSKDFETMKKTAYLVNISRGEIIKKGALRKALWDNQIAGAGVDVTREDDVAELLEYAKEHDDLIITNHIGGLTVESSHMTELHIAEKVTNILNHSL